MIRNPNRGPLAWFGNLGLSLSGWLVLAFLLLPILVVLPLSFSDSRYMSLPLGQFTLHWYEEFFASPQWLGALLNSFAIAVTSTILAVVLGGLAALGLRHPAMPGKRLIEVLLIAPMIVPAVIVGVGMYFVFSSAGLTRTFPGLVLAHTTLAVPFVVVNVGSALGGVEPAPAVGGGEHGRNALDDPAQGDLAAGLAGADFRRAVRLRHLAG